MLDRLKSVFFPPGEEVKGGCGLVPLYEPANPTVDFVFVHGLGGGSRKTWSKSDRDEHYWPKEWLPHDPCFQDVRIHSFGYNSDWMSMKQDVANISDFALSLLNEIKFSKSIRSPNNVTFHYSQTARREH